MRGDGRWSQNGHIWFEASELFCLLAICGLAVQVFKSFMSRYFLAFQSNEID